MPRKGEGIRIGMRVITLNKWRQLKTQMQTLGILEDDIDEKFIIGSGHGGQKLHKTKSCVYLKHRPTGFEVKCQASRMRSENRFLARRLLCEKITEQLSDQKSKRQQEMEKIRRQKRRRSRKAKQKILDAKHQRSKLKQLRKPPGESDS